jgi:predicted nucleotide-binding protein
LSLAESLGRKPDSSAFRGLLSASLAYGLTEGSYAQAQIKLTSLGISITQPQSDVERRSSLAKAARNIPIYDDLYRKFDQAKLPPDVNFRNTLIREHYVEPGFSNECIEFFKADGKFTGLIRDVSGSDRVDLQQAFVDDDSEEDRGSAGAEGDDAIDVRAPRTDTIVKEERGSSESLAPKQPDAPPKNAIFIGHGKDLGAVDQLTKLLERMGVKGIVAKDEAHAGRPISQKVADCMRECSAGIFIASADDDAIDAKGNPIKRARENVIYELGAASFAYGQRIVIFKEGGVEFPTDFSDLGYIEYEKGHLADKFTDLIGELVKLKAVRISAGD